MDLKGFLKQNVDQAVNIKAVISQRMKDENGKPYEWEIRPLSIDEDEELRKEATKRIPGRRRGEYTPDVDIDAYKAKMAAASVVFPNLNSVELQDSYGVKSAEQLVKAMLLNGEYIDLITIIQSINGYDPTEEDIKEAKN